MNDLNNRKLVVVNSSMIALLPFKCTTAGSILTEHGLEKQCVDQRNLHVLDITSRNHLDKKAASIVKASDCGNQSSPRLRFLPLATSKTISSPVREKVGDCLVTAMYLRAIL